MKTENQTIYLDSQATTPVDPEVLETMIPYFTTLNGNGNHRLGWTASSAIETARYQVSSLIKARPSEIIFTSGATEAINLGLLGLVDANQSNRKHIITQKTEHAAVLRCVEELEQRGYQITYLDVDSVGRIDLDKLDAAITEETLVVAIMLANNEIGTVQPVAEIGERCRSKGALFFCDITQGLGWHLIDVDAMKIDLASMSSHKIYGPRGSGALFLRKRKPAVGILPQTFGGGQERGLRSGTANLPAIVGFGKACEIYHEQSKSIHAHVLGLRNHLYEKLVNGIDGLILNGCAENRHPGNLSLAIPNMTGEELIGGMPEIMFSTNSACTGTSAQISHVIDALNAAPFVGKNTFRMGLNKFNTIEEMEIVSNRIISFVREKTSALEVV